MKQSPEDEQQLNERQEERERKEVARRQEFERQQQEHEAERTRRAEVLKAREVTFDRILENAPPMFTAVQLRVLLRALVNLDPYTFTDDVAEHFADESNQQTAEEILLATIDGLTDEKLTGFALRLVLTGHVAIPSESEFDFLTEAETAFVPPHPKKEKKPKKTPFATKTPAEKTATKKKVAV